MLDVDTPRPPIGIRVLYGARREPDWLTMTQDELVAYRTAENRKRASRPARLVTGFPDRGAFIDWEVLELADRQLTVRTYRPRPNRTPGRRGLPLVVHVHGGGFVGTAAQCDWANSHLAARLPAVVVSVEHRLLDHQTSLAAAVDDGWDAVAYAVRNASSRWGADGEGVAVMGESTGALVAAMTAVRARRHGLCLAAQVLVNPVADLTLAGLEVPSMRQHSTSATLTLEQMQLLQHLAIPAGSDPQVLSPMYADDLGGLAPALVVVPTADPLADHGRGYAERLSSAGTPVRLAEYRGAPHAFLTAPGLVRQAGAARAEITAFLRSRLWGQEDEPRTERD